jgi:hypothetical protein
VAPKLVEAFTAWIREDGTVELAGSSTTSEVAEVAASASRILGL